jgi:hypothetical protein
LEAEEKCVLGKTRVCQEGHGMDSVIWKSGNCPIEEAFGISRLLNFPITQFLAGFFRSAACRRLSFSAEISAIDRVTSGE